MNWEVSRRNFLAGSVGFAALGNPIAAAARSVGVKAGDLPDLTIKEVKVYVTDLGNYRSLNGETGELFSVVTNGGIEGNYTPGNRNPTVGWLQWAKSALVGKNSMEPTDRESTYRVEVHSTARLRSGTAPPLILQE
jgi:hypothetical protein